MGALIKDFLSNKLRPVLKPRGYVKKGNFFLRQSGDIIYIINIQGSCFSWEGNETFYVNVGIVSTAVEDAVGHACSIKETSPSKLLYSQVNLRAEELVPIEKFLSPFYSYRNSTFYLKVVGNDVIVAHVANQVNALPPIS